MIRLGLTREQAVAAVAGLEVLCAIDTIERAEGGVRIVGADRRHLTEAREAIRAAVAASGVSGDFEACGVSEDLNPYVQRTWDAGSAPS